MTDTRDSTEDQLDLVIQNRSSGMDDREQHLNRLRQAEHMWTAPSLQGLFAVF
jgi:hypothetical protein